jgi:transcriptional regulator GlxA family with amidase domain
VRIRVVDDALNERDFQQSADSFGKLNARLGIGCNSGITMHFSATGGRPDPSDASRLFVRDGNIYTSGGITAGMDLALALVEEDVGPEVMLAVARTMVLFPRRPGGQSQFSAYTHLEERTNRQDIVQLRTWMMAHPEHDLSVPALADRLGMSPRNFSRRQLSLNTTRPS